jgi:hypothetical protein
VNRHQFAHDVLLGVAGVSGIHHLGGLWALGGWMVAESGSEKCDGVSGARFNPLNTTLMVPGSTPFNSVGVQNYATYGDGVRATVETLSETPFRKIVGAMKVVDAGEGAALSAIDILWEVIGSPWGTSGKDAYNGLATFLANKSFYNQLLVGA